MMREQGRVYNEEFSFRVKSGGIHTMLFSMDQIKIGDEACLISVSNDITERKKAEEALKESEEKFSKAFRHSPEIIAITALKDGKFIDVNDSFLNCTGYSRKELTGHTTSSINIWANKEELEERIRILIEQGRVSNKEYQFRTKSGEIRTWLYSAELVTIGGETCLMSVSNDITERKLMQETIANEAIRRRILIEQSSDGIVIINQNGKVYDVNWRFAEMLGYTMDEASALNIWDWDVNFTRDELMEQLKNIDSEGDHFVSKNKRKDGTIIDVDISTNGATFAGQKLIFCVCRDISERNIMEKALRESEEKFSLAFNSSPHMIIITDMENGNYVEVNDTFVNNTGYTREELVGHNYNELNLWVDPLEMQRMVQKLVEQGGFKNDEYNFRTKSGEIRTWLCSGDIVSIGGKKRMLAIAADITERKKAEEALRESEERFSRAFSASPISLSISRLGDGKFLEVNESFLRDKGYTRDEIIGQSSKKLSIWTDMEEQKHFMNLLNTQGHVNNEQMHYRTKSGEIRIGLVSAETVKIGKESCMLILNNDITQQKQAEEQLRLLSSVTKQVSDSTIITDPNFRITFMNQAAQDLFGYTIDEARGKSLAIFNKIPPTEENRQIIKKTMEAGKVYSAIISKKRKDGTTIICDCRISPMYDEKGKIVSLIDVQRDITKQKDVETKLQEHKKLIDSILATMPEGVLVIDNQDRVLLANKSLYKILHLTHNLTKNKPLSEVLPLDQYFNIHRAVTSENTDNNTLEFRYNVHDMEKIIYCVIVKMDGARTLITFSDVSREREEEEKLYLTDRLASIGEMAAGLAHELNNPLTGILTLSQLLVGSDIPEEHKEDLECIHTEAKRAAGIVKNVLLFARNKTDETGRASANEVMKDVLRLREYEQRSNNIKVVTALEDNLPDVPLDKGQLQQVFLNMLSNAEAAIKEANRPGILTVTTQHVNNHVNVYFSDNGCGIKKQIMPRIFDPFFTTKEVGKGTGLGLSICYSIIVKHGGKISVKSQVNEGTTFTIRIPVVN
jgi:PAS domain S-box-containing protein